MLIRCVSTRDLLLRSKAIKIHVGKSSRNEEEKKKKKSEILEADIECLVPNLRILLLVNQIITSYFIQTTQFIFLFLNHLLILYSLICAKVFAPFILRKEESQGLLKLKKSSNG